MSRNPKKIVEKFKKLLKNPQISPTNPKDFTNKSKKFHLGPHALLVVVVVAIVVLRKSNAHAHTCIRLVCVCVRWGKNE